MERREFIQRVFGALGIAGLAAGMAEGGEASDWRGIYLTFDGEHWHQAGQVQLSKITAEFIGRVDAIRQELQTSLDARYCAILWDGPPESVIGSCSPQLDTWPARLKAKLPFPITLGRCVNC